MKHIIAILLFTFIVFSGKSEGIHTFHEFSGNYYSSSMLNNEHTGFGFMYSPRINLLRLGNHSSLSLNSEIAFGFNNQSNYRSNINPDKTLHENWHYQLPVHLDVNLGHLSSRNNRSAFGGYFGFGWAFNSLQTTTRNVWNGHYILSDSIRGLYFNTGIRFKSGAGSFGTGFYTILGKEDRNLIGVRIFTSFPN